MNASRLSVITALKTLMRSRVSHLEVDFNKEVAAEDVIGVAEEAEEALSEVSLFEVSPSEVSPSEVSHLGDNRVNPLNVTDVVARTTLQHIAFNGNDGNRCLLSQAPESARTLRKRVFQVLESCTGLNQD